MPATRRLLMAATAIVAVALGCASAAHAQSSRDTQRKLDKVNRELKTIASERRKLDGQRGDASKQLRAVDERVGSSSRALLETESALDTQGEALAALQRKRDTMRTRLSGQRTELASLLRAAYTVGDAAPLKLMLSQDRVADANRTLTYHRYLQRERAKRIAALTAELAGLERVERDIATRQAVLDTARQRQQSLLAELKQDRSQQAKTVDSLDKRFTDRASREKALGRDAKALQSLIAQLRAAAARAEAQRKAAAASAMKRDPDAAPAVGRTQRPPPITVARTAPIQVGGLGWPVAGSLLAGFGGTMPDGRTSTGVLIGAAAGTTVKAVADGTVVFSQWMTGYGQILIIDHGNGYMSLYAHNDALLKDAGAPVKRGDAVASVGNSGGQGRPGLYFELRHDGKPVNPNAWLQKR